MPSRRTPKIKETEWNFRPLPANQEHDCLVWELARESETIRSKVKARKQRGGSYVLNAATAIRFTAESFCLHFKFLLDYFPETPWRDIPSNPGNDASPEIGLNVLLSKFAERRGFTVMHEKTDVASQTSVQRNDEQFLALAETHVVPFRALINLSYTDTAIQDEFAIWLAGKRKLACVKAQVAKLGIVEREGRGRKAQERTALKQLSIMRLMHAMVLENAIKTENRAAKKAGELGFYEKYNETVQWQSARRNARRLLNEYFPEIPTSELPLNFNRFSE